MFHSYKILPIFIPQKKKKQDQYNKVFFFFFFGCNFLGIKLKQIFSHRLTKLQGLPKNPDQQKPYPAYTSSQQTAKHKLKKETWI